LDDLTRLDVFEIQNEVRIATANFIFASRPWRGIITFHPAEASSEELFMRRFLILFLLVAIPSLIRADGPKDNLVDNVRRVPPPGVKVSDADREELEIGLKAFAKGLKEVAKHPLLPDVEIYYKAVHDALKYDEFFNVKEIAEAKNFLKIGQERLSQLHKDNPQWVKQTGLVVRGYRSKIDDSVQPYSVVVPKDYDFKKKIRLDFWAHGRGETLSELNFMKGGGSPFVTDKAIVLNLYGRYCCANKLAGEVDCFEALEHAKKNYAIDEDRLVMRGFSMGGAAAWHFAAHYPSMWCAAAPGAGFSETPDFLKVFQNEIVTPPWYEKKLWHMYDCTDYALNFYNLPTVAYSGADDKQKQAADIMAKAMKEEGLELNHIIGPKTGHGYEKAAKEEIIKQIDAIAEKGRNPVPTKIKFVTYTLRYNQCFWLVVTGLDQHWERAQAEAEVVGKSTIRLSTKNISQLFFFVNEEGLLAENADIKVEIDGQNIPAAFKTAGGGKFFGELEKRDGRWIAFNGARKTDDSKLVKHSFLQGPIDDAFLSRFTMVRPTGKPLNEQTGKWAEGEMKHAITHWRQQFRGEAIQKDDKDITDDDIKNSNLILWGDPSSNAVLKKIADKLPITWKDGKVVLGADSFDGAMHVPLLIYPNPLNPRKYVVLNSGFTFREYDYLNNARQIPKLPDYAIVDTTTPPNSRTPGKIATAGFFDEEWKLKAKR